MMFQNNKLFLKITQLNFNTYFIMSQTQRFFQGIIFTSKPRIDSMDLRYNDWIILDNLKNQLLNHQNW